MTWRAFIIGLLAVAGIAVLDPYASLIAGYGWITTHSFPSVAVFVLVFLVVVVNVLLKLIRRRWALTQAELMLVWCMVIVGATIPCQGIGRFWYSLIAGPPYLARRLDYHWEEKGSLTHAPEGLVLSKDIRSVAAEQFYEGVGEGARIPWRAWLPPLLQWGGFLLLLYLAVFFLCGIIRRHWVDVERLMFPLARVPLEFAEGSAGRGLLPALFTNKSFLVGLVVAGSFRLFRALPVIFGTGNPMAMMIPLKAVFAGTPLEHGDFHNFPFFPQVVGFAFLVPADVSLSIWFFYLFSRVELMISYSLALPEGHDTWSPLMRRQQFGAYLAFSVGMVYMARRHLWAVLRKALGRRDGLDDTDEPIRYRLAVWGFLACVSGCVIWCCYHGMKLHIAVAALALMFCAFMVYARLVAQSGVHVTRTLWIMPRVIHSFGGGYAFSPAGAVIGYMQSILLLRGATTVLAPMAIHAFRIAEVFKKGRRLLFPALVLAIIVAMVCTSYTVLSRGYRQGALSFQVAPTGPATTAFGRAHRVITQPEQKSDIYLRPILLGTCGMAFLMFMRGRFYWWPIHPIGLLTCSHWNIHRIWFPFLLGWLAKVGIMKFGGGRMLRKARYFFIAVILVEAFTASMVTLLRFATQGAVPRF